MLSRFVFIILTVVSICLLNPTYGKTNRNWNIGDTRMGVASWYGDWHHGRKMANGKPFNMWANTVAHKTLPLGTKVRVTNPASGQSIVCTITDRGPYHGNRIMDLSKGVAQKLGIKQQGVGKIEFEVLSIPVKKPKETKRKFVDTRDSIEILLTSLNLTGKDPNTGNYF